MSDKKKIRLDYLDIAKCIAIFLVIIGHTTGNTDTPAYRVILYSFHMPLFFIVSGTVIRKHQHAYDWNHWKNFLIKNVLTLIVPYFIWSLIFSKFSNVNLLQILYGSWQSLAVAETVTSFWYLPCLFVARIIMEVILMLAGKVKMNRHLFAGLISIIAFLIGFALSDLLRLEKGYPWCIDISFVALGFMLIGYSFKDVLNKCYEKNILFHIITLIISCGVFVFSFLIRGMQNVHLVLMCGSDYGASFLDILYFMISSLSGIIMSLSFSIIISKILITRPNSVVRKTMIWIGQSTLGIFLVHKPFLQEVVMANFKKGGANLPSFGWAVLGAFITLIFACIVMAIIEKFIPQLFGKFPNYKTVKVVEEEPVLQEK